MSARFAPWAAVAAFLALAAVPAHGEPPPHGDLARAARAREATLGLDVEGARRILEGADESDPALTLERARLAIYAQDCDEAASLSARNNLGETKDDAELTAIARGCARATAATIVQRSPDSRVEIRVQDDDDQSLAPLLTDVALRARELLAKELGVTLPVPLRLVIVRDQLSLAVMTGLPEEAARTTGTVAVAKWGRVTMISPRAARDGYAWQDTLVHELTHLALTAGSSDKAPLWLQEGVAKREEVRWRDPQPFDDMPPIDVVASLGMEKGLGRPIDKLGPSIAMLPTAEQAQVAFAEVSSFIRFWVREAGDEALPQLLLRLRASRSDADLTQAIADVSGADLSAWDGRWKAYLSSVPRTIASDLAPGASLPHASEIARRLRLGELLAARSHPAAASIELGLAQKLAPREPSLRCHLAAALLASDRRDEAASLVAHTEDVHGQSGRYWSLHGLFEPEPARDLSFARGIAIDPLDPNVACEEKPSPELPSDLLRAAICAMARRAPR